MKITINRLGGGPVKFEDFADANGLEMEVNERGIYPGVARYYAQFVDTDVKQQGCLVGEFGNGMTPEEAVDDYRHRIAGKRLVVGAFKGNRREIQCPSEWAP